MKLSWKSTSRPAVAMAVALFVGAAFAPTPASADRWKDKGGHRGQKKHATVYCPAPVVRHAPRYVYSEPCTQPVIYVSRRPFYEYRQLGMYVPQSWINVQIGNRAPRGYVFYDPYCHRTFSTLGRFRAHKRGPGHMVALDIVAVDDLRWEGRNAYYARDYEECGYDDGRYNDYGDDRHWDDRDRTHWSVSAQINVD